MTDQPSDVDEYAQVSHKLLALSSNLVSFDHVSFGLQEHHHALVLCSSCDCSSDIVEVFDKGSPDIRPDETHIASYMHMWSQEYSTSNMALSNCRSSSSSVVKVDYSTIIDQVTCASCISKVKFLLNLRTANITNWPEKLLNEIKELSNQSIWFRNEGCATAMHWTMVLNHLSEIPKLAIMEEKLDTLNSKIVSVAEVWSSTVVGSNSTVERNWRG